MPFVTRIPWLRRLARNHLVTKMSRGVNGSEERHGREKEVRFIDKNRSVNDSPQGESRSQRSGQLHPATLSAVSNGPWAFLFRSLESRFGGTVAAFIFLPRAKPMPLYTTLFARPLCPSTELFGRDFLLAVTQYRCLAPVSTTARDRSFFCCSIESKD